MCQDAPRGQTQNLDFRTSGREIVSAAGIFNNRQSK